MGTVNVDAKDAGKGEREKFINNFSGFFGMKPSSKNPALLQSCKFTSMKVHLCTTRKSWEMPFLSKNVVLFTETVWTGDFVFQDEPVNFPFAEKHSKLLFFFPSSFA